MTPSLEFDLRLVGAVLRAVLWALQAKLVQQVCTRNVAGQVAESGRAGHLFQC